MNGRSGLINRLGISRYPLSLIKSVRRLAVRAARYLDAFAAPFAENCFRRFNEPCADAAVSIRLEDNQCRNASDNEIIYLTSRSINCSSSTKDKSN